jgi:diaminopimelate decarboxylase
MQVEDWGFSRGPTNELLIGGVSAVEIARRFGTPLHVVDEGILRHNARSLRKDFEAQYPQAQLFYALKCNSVAGVVQTIFEEGFGGEVTSEYEFWLARRLGMPAGRILLNGPNKSDALLRHVVREGIGAVVVDSIPELERLDSIANESRGEVQVLLRVNPDFVPRGMNRASATGCRKGSVFGLDLRSGELRLALDAVRTSASLRYAGIHTHIGTGIRHPEDYARAFRQIVPAFLQARAAGLETRIFDFGGGFGVPTSKEFSTLEFLAYQGWGRLPHLEPHTPIFPPHVCAPLQEFCRREGLPLPTLYLEPGRAIASSAQVLLLTVGAVKDRTGVGKWVITDGGAGTCAFPLYYECHEVVLANNVAAPPVERVRLVGPVCFASNWIYRNKVMPVLKPGDVIAVMDSGAYFLALEANFGFPRTTVMMVSDGQVRLVRRRETFEEMAARDIFEDKPYADAAPGNRI